MSRTAEQELVAVAHAWDEAMVSNDAEAIGQYMADEWTIVGQDGGMTGKADFLALVRSGDLTHDVMTTEDPLVRIYGGTAVTIARGVSGGTFHGRPFRVVERVSCVFVRHPDGWKCVLTHLSPLVAMGGR
jgi:ketosteroid isomerase-like protein